MAKESIGIRFLYHTFLGRVILKSTYTEICISVGWALFEYSYF